MRVPGLYPSGMKYIFLGAVDHFQVLPPVEECLEEAHIFNRKDCDNKGDQAQSQPAFPWLPHPLQAGARLLR